MSDQNKPINQLSDLELARANGQLWQQLAMIQGQLQAVNSEIEMREKKSKLDELTAAKAEVG